MTQHALLSASGAYRWLACPGSVALARKLPPGASSIYAAEGSLAHDIASQTLEGAINPLDCIGKRYTKDGHEFVVDEDMIEHVETYTGYCDLIGEQSDWHAIETRISLDSMWGGKPPTPLFGTLDFGAYSRKSETLEIVDLKYGRGVAVEVADNPQPLYYACGSICLVPGPVSRVRATIVQPRADHPLGAIRSVEYDMLDVQIWFDTVLRPGVERVMAGDTTLVAGDHCRFCPARAVCPALTALATKTARMDFGPLPPAANTLTEAELAEVLDKAEIIREWIDAVRGEASQRADRGLTIPGWKLAPKRASRKWVNDDLVEGLLSKLGFPPDKTHKQTLKSVAQIEKLLTPEQNETLLPLIDKSSSGTTLVPDHDPREAVTKRRASDDFAADPGAGIF